MGSDLASLFLCGVFRIEDQDGRRVAIQSAKAQGLLALLATAPKAERSRAWLQSMLWSDRGADQASASLRQTLTQLRRALSPAGIVLETDRGRVALDLSTVRIETSGSGEFLEGLDIRDEEFEYWLTTERARRDAEPAAQPAVLPGAETPSFRILRPSPAPLGWSLAIMPQSTEPDTVRRFEAIFADGLARCLREVYTAPVHVGPAAATTDWQLIARLESFVTGAQSTTIRIVIEHPAAQRQVWSGYRDLPSAVLPSIDHPDLQQMVNELIDGLGDYLVLSGGEPAEANTPDRLFRLAIRSLFSMEPDRIDQADRMLAQSMDMERRGLYLAWRMQLRAIQLIERHAIDREATKEECQNFFAQALDLEPNNSMVLATLANSLRQFARDDERSLFLAQRSVRLNPANSYAWWSLSAASSYVGNAEAAYRDARAGHHMAILSPHRFWWDNQVFTSALMSGRTSEALKFAEAAHAGNPGFRAPLRYLVALHANAGNLDKALQAAEKLRRLEPDFSIERLLKDRNYPASLVHSAPNLDRDRIATLI